MAEFTSLKFVTHQSEGALQGQFKPPNDESWQSLLDRSFLCGLHGTLPCELRLGKLKAAIAQMEQHLRWNPNDNLGVRYLIGDAQVLTFACAAPVDRGVPASAASAALTAADIAGRLRALRL